MKDEDFLIAFEAGEAPGGRFNHEDHVRAAWLMVHDRGPMQAMLDYDEALRRLVRRLGAEAKYDAPLTEHFLAWIAGRVIDRPSENWADFRNKNPDLFESAAIQAMKARTQGAPSARF